jgi:5-formyltetrahydrofolate cyclo-ligase
MMTKQESRAYFLQKRVESCPADSAAIAARLEEILTLRPTGLIHSYINDSTKNEVDTRLIRQLLRISLPGLRWAAPRIIPGTRNMQHFAWDDATSFIPNRWGIAEPDPFSSQHLDIQRIDAVLVPLLAYDRLGHRAGYGGGYYDRFLAECRPDTWKIGLSFFDPLDAISDVDEWDIPLDLCVTPSTVYRWNPRF